MTNKPQRIGAALAVAGALLGGAGAAWGAASDCGNVGTWFGQDPTEGGLRWIAINMPGTSATTGEMSLKWTMIDPSFGGYFPDATQMTDGSGVWQLVSQGVYRFTFVTYGTMLVAGRIVVPVYAMRVSGTGTLTTCDHSEITYTAEFFSPDLAIRYDAATGIGANTQDRMKLVTVQ